MIILSEYTSFARHEPAVVHALWSSPESWPTWDPEVASVAFNGAASVGATGRLPRGSELRVTIGVDGPFAWLWRRVLGSSMSRAAHSSVTGLVAYLDGESA